jgi:hypothetical protein
MKGALLWKRILNGGLRPIPHLKYDVESRVKQIITAPIIVAPELQEAEGGSNWYDLSGVSIPFDRFWIEGTTSETVAVGYTWGCLYQSTRDADRFHVLASCCYAARDFSPEILGDIEFDLDLSGNPIQHTFGVEAPAEFIKLCGGEATAGAVISGPALAAGLSLMILRCKNVSLQPHDNEPKQVRRAIKRHGGTPDSYRYHTLVVRPPGAHKDSPVQEIGVMPHHVCRGHFAEYGPEFNKGLLFGKYAGRFYVPPCVKGNRNRGVVEKDYQIAEASR